MVCQLTSLTDWLMWMCFGVHVCLCLYLCVFVPLCVCRSFDLTELVQCSGEPQPIYDLYAISNHFGGMGGGHCECMTCMSSLMTLEGWVEAIEIFGVCFSSQGVYVVALDTAYAKSKDSAKWYNYDDSHVSEVAENRLVVSKTSSVIDMGC